MTCVERCLYDYKANMATIDVLTMEKNNLKSVYAQNYEGLLNKNISSPVEEVIDRVFSIEQKIMTVKRLTMPIEKLMIDLSGNDLCVQQMRELLIFKYINQEGNRITREKMAVSERTYRRRKSELLRIAKKYFYEST